MGEISIKNCSCIKPKSEEKKTEFFPEIERNRNLGNKINTLNTKEYPYSPATTKENVNIRMTKRKTFSIIRQIYSSPLISMRMSLSIYKTFSVYIRSLLVYSSIKMVMMCLFPRLNLPTKMFVPR